MTEERKQRNYRPPAIYLWMTFFGLSLISGTADRVIGGEIGDFISHVATFACGALGGYLVFNVPTTHD